MKEDKLQQIKRLKGKFREFSGKDRENVGVCFLKVKLGVHSPEEFEVVIKFLDGFEFEINTPNLDSMMNYLHSESNTLPEFIAMEDSLSDIERQGVKSDLPAYSSDSSEVETLKEGVKPFKR